MFFPRMFFKKYKNESGPRRRRKSSTIKYDSDESVKSAILEMLIYIVFLITTTIVANASHHLYMFYFNQTLEKLFIGRELETKFGMEVRFEDLVTTADWWSFMETTFLDDLHGDLMISANQSQIKNRAFYKARNKSEAPKGDDVDLKRLVLGDNILLGPPRLRQIRVKENTCHVNEAFVRYFNSCYSEYSRVAEDRRPIYKDTKFYTTSQLNVNPIRGEIQSYYGAGYVRSLSYDRITNEAILQQLKSTKWIDRGTRIIILEFVLYNSNSLMFDNVKILAELPPVGGIVTSHQFQALKLHSIWSDMDYVVYVTAVIFYLMVIFYTCEEIGELLTIGAVDYFKSMWNLVDLTVLLFSYLSFAYNIIHPKYLRNILEKSQNNPNVFWSIDKICFWNILYIDMMGVCVFLVWIKIFKYISINKTMLQFSITLKRCAKDLCGFAVMFFIVFLAYAQLGLLIFGTSHPDFREFGISVITLMRMFLGDFEYQLIEEANHILGPIYFLTYVLFVFFVLLNMFLAIINDTYGSVKSEVNQGHSNFGSYFAKLFRRIYCCHRRDNEEASRKSKNGQDNRNVRRDSQVLLHDVRVAENSDRNHIGDSSVSLYPVTDDSSPPESERLRVRVSELIREYFEELPANEYKLQNIPQNAKENYDIRRLTNRIALLEEVLEQLITDMDRILRKIEAKQRTKK